MKHLLLILSLAFYSLAQAQSGNISGKVTDQRNNPLANVNIAVSNTSLGTNTNYSGNYEIPDLAPGAYTLTFSMVGFGTQNKTVRVYADQTTNVQTITLVERQEQLNEVVVEGSQVNKCVRNGNIDIGQRVVALVCYFS